MSETPTDKVRYYADNSNKLRRAVSEAIRAIVYKMCDYYNLEKPTLKITANDIPKYNPERRIIYLNRMSHVTSILHEVYHHKQNLLGVLKVKEKMLLNRLIRENEAYNFVINDYAIWKDEYERTVYPLQVKYLEIMW